MRLSLWLLCAALLSAEGDIITEINETPIRSAEDYLRAVSSLTVGQEITLSLFRDGQTRTVRVTLGARPDRR